MVYSHMNTKQQIRHSFNQHASDYDGAAKIQQEIGMRLFARLDYLKMTPQYVLDLGSGTGYFAKCLKKYYPKAKIIAFDLAYKMLLCSKDRQSWLRPWSLVNGDMEQLPFEAGIFDLIFANQTIHWSTDLSLVFQEINRVMSPQACFMFSSLGPDTFLELRHKEQSHQHYAHANQFLDMHLIGDALMREFFVDPVMDMEQIVAHYASFEHLIASLKNQGVVNINPLKNHALTGKKRWQAFKDMVSAEMTAEGKFPLTYEVVYGHAWKSLVRRDKTIIETRVPLATLKRQNSRV